MRSTSAAIALLFLLAVPASILAVPTVETLQDLACQCQSIDRIEFLKAPNEAPGSTPGVIIYFVPQTDRTSGHRQGNDAAIYNSPTKRTIWSRPLWTASKLMDCINMRSSLYASALTGVCRSTMRQPVVLRETSKFTEYMLNDMKKRPKAWSAEYVEHRPASVHPDVFAVVENIGLLQKNPKVVAYNWDLAVEAWVATGNLAISETSQSGDDKLQIKSHSEDHEARED